MEIPTVRLNEKSALLLPHRQVVLASKAATTVVVSDIHLASPICRANAFRNFLRDAAFERLIILGDLFDHSDFRRLTKAHWNVLSTLRKLSSRKRGIEIVWIEGNHDRQVIGVVSQMIGATVIRQHQRYVLEAAGKRILLMHGHQFDDFIERRPIVTAVATGIYNTVQRCGGRGRRVSRWLKYKSKEWINASEKNHVRAISHALNQGADTVICGHTHAGRQSELDGVNYINTGSWVDVPSHYLLISERGLELRADWSEE